MNHLPISFRLWLLPPDPADAASCLQVDADGRVIARRRLSAEAPMPVQAAVRDLVAVPAEAVTLLWLDLPARHPLQARAAARLRLEDHLAVPLEGLHVAIGAEVAPGMPRLVAVVDNARMAEWKQRCNALDITAAAWVPDCLLLPPPPTEEGLAAIEIDGRVLVRGANRAFTAEPELVRAIVGDIPLSPLRGNDSDALLAAAVQLPPVLDLLQFDHALPDTRAMRRRRRLTALAAMVLLSPVLLAGAGTLRDLALAAWMGHRADTLAAAALPAGQHGDDASESLHALHRQRLAPSTLASTSTILFDTLQQHPGTQLDSYEFNVGNGLQVGMLHRSEQDLDAMRAMLQAQGVDLVSLDSRAVEGGMRSLLAVESTR